MVIFHSYVSHDQKLDIQNHGLKIQAAKSDQNIPCSTPFKSAPTSSRDKSCSAWFLVASNCDSLRSLRHHQHSLGATCRNQSNILQIKFP